MRTWDDIWLNEGFATYGEVLYLEKAQGLAPGADAADGVRRRPLRRAPRAGRRGRPRRSVRLHGRRLPTRARGCSTCSAGSSATTSFFAGLRAYGRRARVGDGDARRAARALRGALGARPEAVLRPVARDAVPPGPPRDVPNAPRRLDGDAHRHADAGARRRPPRGGAGRLAAGTSFPLVRQAVRRRRRRDGRPT